ncbi:MAG: glycosyltransferase family 4 protein [Bacteroidales bacterium]|jgi:glycosyltransferase involved in cell wall biosynthesis|nr:glycosyltransferase family 4 protein [Bacteroidales bacterium]
MKILFLCNKNPYPERDGGCMGMNVYIKEAARLGNYVKVLAVNSEKNFTDPDCIPDDYKNAVDYESVMLDMRVKPFRFFTTIFTGKSPHIIRFISKDFEKKIIEILKSEDFDLVMFESIFVCPYLDIVRANSNAKIVLRAHNIEFKIWERTSKATKNILKKILLIHVYRTLRKYELRVINEVDMISSVSSVDAEYLRKHTKIPVYVLPAGFDMDAVNVPDNVEEEKNTVFHIGAMDWAPNIEGINYLLEKIWPLIHKENNNIKLHLAGRNMQQSLLCLQKENVIIDGEVPDAKEYMLSKQIMIVPLLSGSGMRVKIIEGMMLGKAIVATSIGAEGIECENGKDILIADTPENFTECVLKLIEDAEFCMNIEKNAKQTAYSKYNVREIYPKFLKEVEKLSAVNPVT